MEEQTELLERLITKNSDYLRNLKALMDAGSFPDLAKVDLVQHEQAFVTVNYQIQMLRLANETLLDENRRLDRQVGELDRQVEEKAILISRIDDKMLG
jgi:hypothetical protein